MSQELIQALQRTKLDAIMGDFYGGNDEGGINAVYAVILKPEYPVDKWPGNDNLSKARELSMQINMHGHYREHEWINECSFAEATKRADDIAHAGIPEDMDLWKLVKPFFHIIDSSYGSFAGDFTVSGEFYATRDGRFKVIGTESVPTSEDVCLAEETYA